MNAEGWTVKAALDKYVEHMKKAGKRTRTVTTTESAIRCLLDEVDRPLADVTPRLLNRQLEALGGSVDYRASALRMTKTWVRWCTSQGWISRPVRARLETVKVVGRRLAGEESKPQLTVDESRAYVGVALERAAAAHTPMQGAESKLDYRNRRARAEGALAALCPLLLGLRAREILDRQVRDLDNGGQELWVRKAKTAKGNRRVMVPEVLRTLLLAHVAGRESTARIFGESDGLGRPRSASWLRKHVRMVCEVAQVPVVCPHGLRGTHATLAEAAGVASQVVAESLGHATPDITGRHYTKAGVRATAAQGRALAVIQGGLVS